MYHFFNDDVFDLVFTIDVFFDVTKLMGSSDDVQHQTELMSIYSNLMRHHLTAN